MHQSISVIARDKSGKLGVMHEHLDATEPAIEALIDGLKETGHTAIIVLLADDSVFRHWTAPR